MSKKNMSVMVGGTLTCALAIGFFMQRGETAAPRNLVPELPAKIQQVVLKPAVSFEGSLAPAPLMTADVATQADMQNLVLASSRAPVMISPSLPENPNRAQNQVQASAQGSAPPADPQAPQAPQLGCNVTATATPGEFAMIALKVSAPCFPNERLTVHHSGMMFTQVTDQAGDISVTVPALNDRAVFIVAFGNGKGTVAIANAPDVHKYDRVAVQWTGDLGFQVHAREFGASYGESGHVWAGAKTQSESGFVTRLGVSDTHLPRMAEVYTFPSGTTLMSGIVALSVEAEVTTENCGRDISAQSLELRDRSSLRIRDLVLAMPNCDAIGDFLVLNNLVEDLTIASR
ncbi:MAG: hypothetical protein L3J36_08000 [Rhodobacteraceae bacterium]|nr:hypothetical protein [Paracoccaceae bacterium]